MLGDLPISEDASAAAGTDDAAAEAASFESGSSEVLTSDAAGKTENAFDSSAFQTGSDSLFDEEEEDSLRSRLRNRRSTASDASSGLFSSRSGSSGGLFSRLRR